MGNWGTGSKVRTPVQGPGKRMLETDSPPSQPGQAPDSAPLAPVSALLLETAFLSFSLLPFFSHAPRIGSVESPVVDLQGSPSTTIHDQTWNPSPPWAGPLHLAEERVLPKVSRRLSAS